MKPALKQLATVMGTVWLIWVSALLYSMVAPRIFGPERSVRAMHASIYPGMTTAKFEASIRQDKDLKVRSPNPEGKQYVSKITGNWLCAFSVQIQDEKVHTIQDVICVD